MLTLEEQERRAYISGNTQLAAVLVALIEVAELAAERLDLPDGDEDVEVADQELVLRYKLAERPPVRYDSVEDLI